MATLPEIPENLENLAVARQYLETLRTSITAAIDSIVTATGIPTSEKGAANGVATLDSGGDVPLSQLGNVSLTESDPVFLTQKGAANGVATLDSGGDVPASQLGNETDPVFLAQKGAANGVATLDSGGDVPASQLGNVSESDPIFLAQKGAANGVATLDATTKIPTSQLGTGTADATKVLFGDRTWGTPAFTISSSLTESASVAVPDTGVFTVLVTVTPVTGTYLVWGTSTGMSFGTGVTAEYDIAVAGTQQGQSVKSGIADVTSGGVNILTPCCFARVTVNGSQAIEFRARQNSTPTNSLNNQLMLLLVS